MSSLSSSVTSSKSSSELVEIEVKSEVEDSQVEDTLVADEQDPTYTDQLMVSL